MLREERSQEFWTRVVSDPSVIGTLSMTLEEFLNCISNPRVTPLASENGGYLIIDLGIGRISEFHGVYMKKGRGRESFAAACDLAEIIFATHDMAVTYEINTNINSKPPLSFGFQKETSLTETPHGLIRLWFLTKSRWESSPVYRRINNKCLH